MKEIYLLSGLGADRRVFDFIDLSGYNLRYINWINPSPQETIESYAHRLLKQIPTKEPILIGVSFGGMMAIEIGKLIATGKIVLVSSARTKFDVPFYYRVFGRLRLNRMGPTRLFKMTNRLTYWFFGTRTKEEERLLTSIIDDTDDRFLRWAMDKIVNWDNVTELPAVTTIHGTADKILPIRKADFSIVDGGHFMVVSKAEELSGLIRNVIA